MVFSGTFSAGGLQVACEDGRLRIVQEGKQSKFVEAIQQVSYSGTFARSEGRKAVFVTERAVFQVTDGALELAEVAPGIDVEKDVLAHMAFEPKIAADFKQMDARLFRPEPMHLLGDPAFAAA